MRAKKRMTCGLIVWCLCVWSKLQLLILMSDFDARGNDDVDEDGREDEVTGNEDESDCVK